MMTSFEVRAIPFSTGTDSLAKVRPVLAVDGPCTRATLKRPRTELPRVAVSDRETLFELPVLHGWELTQGESCDVEVERDGGSRTTQKISRSWLTAESEAADPEIRFVHDHVDSLGEFLFPSASGARQPRRFGGLAPAPWGELIAALRRHAQTQSGALALIVQVADACREVLSQICDEPRRLLRRERRMTDLRTADQLDEACLRWLARQPGTTILDKAGTRQRILAVQRRHSYDTTENRVVRDFIERCRRGCDDYLRNNEHPSESPRVRVVGHFRRHIKRWLATSPIGQVPRPVGTPSANYVLQFDDRYRQIWPWYERLRRQQEDEAEIGRWRHRVWAEHVLLLMAHAAVSAESTIAYGGRSYVWSRPRVGRFIDADASYFDSALCGNVRSPRVRVLSAAAGESSALAMFAPDGILRDCNLMGLPIDGTLVGIWSALAPVDGPAVMATRGAELASRLRSCGIYGVRGLLVLPLRTSQGSANEARPIAVPATRQVLVLALPAPSAGHLDWVRTTVARWIDRRKRVVVRRKSRLA